MAKYNIVLKIFQLQIDFSGSYTLSDVLSMATPAGLSGIRDLQRDIQFDDKCNIVFTSGMLVSIQLIVQYTYRIRIVYILYTYCKYILYIVYHTILSLLS